MKYLKKFEIYSEKLFPKEYKIGDYILLDNIKLEEEGYKCDGLGKIIKIFSRQLLYPYLVLFDNNDQLYLEEDKIVRLLTTEEIELYESKLEAIKYNL